MTERSMTFPDLMTVKDVAAILNVPASTVHHWAMRGEGPPSFKIGRHRRYNAEVFARWLRDRQAAA